LYVLCRNEQRKFAEYIISEIEKVDGYRLAEIFELRKDYRGDPKGMGALFVTKKFDENTKE